MHMGAGELSYMFVSGCVLSFGISSHIPKMPKSLPFFVVDYNISIKLGGGGGNEAFPYYCSYEFSEVVFLLNTNTKYILQI